MFSRTAAIWGIWGLSYLLRLTGWPEFSRVSFFGLGPWQTFVVTGCKLFIILAVLTLAWRRRKVEGRGIWDSIAYGWIIFFVFSPGVCTQYLIWLAPFILLLSPTFYTWLLGSSSIFAFVFYNTISNGLPWYKGASTNALNEDLDTVVRPALAGFDSGIDHALAQGEARRSVPASFQFAPCQCVTEPV